MRSLTALLVCYLALTSVATAAPCVVGTAPNGGPAVILTETGPLTTCTIPDGFAAPDIISALVLLDLPVPPNPAPLVSDLLIFNPDPSREILFYSEPISIDIPAGATFVEEALPTIYTLNGTTYVIFSPEEPSGPPIPEPSTAYMMGAAAVGISLRNLSTYVKKRKRLTL